MVYAVPKTAWNKASEQDRPWTISEGAEKDFPYLGGFYASKEATRDLLSIEIEGFESSVKLAADGITFLLQPKLSPPPTVVRNEPVPLAREPSHLPDEPNRWLFLGVPFAAALSIGILLLFRRIRKSG